MGKGRDKRRKSQKKRDKQLPRGATYVAEQPKFLGQVWVDPGKLHPVDDKEKPA